MATINTTTSFGGFPAQFSRVQANELVNVVAYAPTGGESLTYNNTTTKWENADARLAVQTVAISTEYDGAFAIAFSAEDMIGGVILRDPSGAPRTDVTATAALLVAAFPNAAVGVSFRLVIRNTADAAELITVGPGTGVTLNPAIPTIAQNNSKEFIVRFDNVTAAAEAVTMISLGSSVIG
jgi:hypothetical protein